MKINTKSILLISLVALLYINSVSCNVEKEKNFQNVEISKKNITLFLFIRT